MTSPNMNARSAIAATAEAVVSEAGWASGSMTRGCMTRDMMQLSYMATDVSSVNEQPFRCLKVFTDPLYVRICRRRPR